MEIKQINVRTIITINGEDHEIFGMDCTESIKEQNLDNPFDDDGEIIEFIRDNYLD